MASGNPQEAAVKPEDTSVQMGPPPAYDGDTQAAPADVHPSAGFTPPAYDVATKLPTYDEAERSKAAEAGFPTETPCPDRAARENRRANGSFFFWSGPGLLLSDTRRGATNDRSLSHAQLQQQVLGSELEFLCCFLVALMFNWIGLFAAMCCLTVTIAGRAGAISGFGLSVVKWAFLVMHQSYLTRATFGWTSSTGVDTPQTTDTYVTDTADLDDNKWFTVSCWLIVALGLLCFLQGIIHYVRAKKCARDQNWLRERYNSQLF